MEFAEKLQQLRKQADLTQEQLAKKLYVSRTAVSKWETGNGYPNLDSLKAIAKTFKVSVDELLSNDELIELAGKEAKQTSERMLGIVFGALDMALLLFFFIPLFGVQEQNGFIAMVPLLKYDGPNYFLIPFSVTVVSLALVGAVEIVGSFKEKGKLCKRTCLCSLVIHVVAVLVFLTTQQPYATQFLFVFLVIKFTLMIYHNSRLSR